MLTDAACKRYGLMLGWIPRKNIKCKRKDKKYNRLDDSMQIFGVLAFGYPKDENMIISSRGESVVC